VPPLVTPKVPIQEGVKVWVFPEEVMVRPRLVSEEVAKVWVEPVCPAEYSPAREVMAEERLPKQVPPGILKQPLESSMPFAKVEVAEVEVMFKAFACTPQAKVEVAVVEVAVR
jgi:hypothetical protein